MLEPLEPKLFYGTGTLIIIFGSSFVVPKYWISQ